MNAPVRQPLEGRLLLLAPTAKDAEVSRAIFAEAGIDCHVCKTLEETCAEIERGGGAALLTQETILADKSMRLTATLGKQPPWSDFPVLVLTPAGPDADPSRRALEVVGHMTLIKRPVQIAALVSTVRAALRDRSRQYAARDYFVEREFQAEALRLKDEQFRFALQTARMGSWEVDLTDDSLTCTDAFKANFGLPPESVFSYRDLFDSVQPEDRQRVREALRQSIATGKDFEEEFRVSWPDGSTHWILTRGQPFFAVEGEPSRIVGLTLDITDRKRQEEALREAEARLRFTIHVARLGEWDIDLATGVARCSARHDQIFGHVGNGPAWNYQTLLNHVHPEDRDRVDRAFVQSVDRGEEWDVQCRIVRKDGSPGWVWIKGQTLREGSHRPSRMIGAVADITEQKQAELMLRENDRRKDEFLAMLAHELRNPLAAINGATQVFGMPEVGPADFDWGRGVLNRQVKQLSRLIDDLLDVSRITSGKIRLRREVFNASPVLVSAVDVVRPLIEDRKHEVTVSLTPEPLRLHADPARIEQILVNLITNAAKYTDGGGRISISAGREGGMIVFRVRDNGMGISPEKLPTMFELFAQGDRTLARSEGGLGIGLTLVKALAEMHGGTVTATSSGAGSGSEFEVRLPEASQTALEDPLGAPDSKKQTRRARVLIVDDNADAASGLARLLKLLGHEVRTAHGGPEAIGIAKEYSPEVVLLDIGLPGMDGYEVARRLRSEDCYRDSLLIAITGYGQDQDRRRSKEAGFDHHLVKPLDYDALITLISQSVASR